MSSEKIFDKIVEETRQKGETILKKYTDEAEEYTSSNRVLIDDDISEKTAYRKKKIIEEYSQKVSACRIENNMTLHNRKFQYMNEVYKDFKKDLSDRGEYVELFYIKLFTDLLKKYGVDGDKIIINDSDKSMYTDDIIPGSGRNISLSDETITETGFLIDRGDININCTMRQLESKIRELSENKMDQLLFG